MTRLRVGVIGLGAMGRNHVRVLSDMESVELVGVSDVSPEAVERVAQKYRIPGFAAHHELLRQAAPAAVVVAVPTSLHLAVVLDAVQAGVHVLVEKPIAQTVEQGRRMIAAARQAGVLLTVGHVERFNPAVRALAERLDRGELGRIFQIHTRRLGPFPSRVRDVGVVTDLGSHDLDIVCHLLGSHPVRVYAETQRRIHTEHEDSANIVLRFANGISGIVELNWLTPTKVRDLTVLGERGMFRVDYLTQRLTLYENSFVEGSWESLNALLGVAEGNITSFPLPLIEPLRAELEAFEAAARGHGSSVSPEDAVAALRLAHLVIESGERGAVVQCGPPHGEELVAARAQERP